MSISGSCAPEVGFNIGDFAWFPGGFAVKAAELAQLAQAEPWGDPAAAHADDLSVLLYYLSNTARRVGEQQLFEFRTDARGVKVAAFNTGLFTDNYESIFALLEANEQTDRQPWVFKGWMLESDHRMRSFGDSMPQSASFFDDPTYLLYDVSMPLNARLNHIVDDNVDRYPDVLRDNKHLRLNALEGAIAGAKKRVRQNYKTAVPHWYWPTSTADGHLQLLLPLRLVSPQPELALVVDRVGDEYVAYTVLPLDVAYKRARLVARPDVDWLSPTRPQVVGDAMGRWASRGDRCFVCGAETDCLLAASNNAAFCRRVSEGGEQVTVDGVTLWRHRRTPASAAQD